MKLFDALASHSNELLDAASAAPFIVFLCGPKIDLDEPASRLRKRLQDNLTEAGFDVVLGEDEGLVNDRLKHVGIHVAKHFVGNLDVKDFFGSVSTQAVKDHLESSGFKQDEATVISMLCTNDNHLPQGAPRPS
jgi:hypothetical protein